MDKKERKALEDYFVNKEGWNKNVTKFHTWRAYLFSKVGIYQSIKYLNDKFAKKILEETDESKLAKKLIFGKLKTLASYPIILGSGITSLIMQDYTPIFIGGSVGLYLNWSGEINWLNSEIRMKQLGIDKQKAMDNYFKPLLDKLEEKAKD